MKKWIIAAIAIALAIFSLPYLFSIPPLKQIVVWKLEQRLGGKAQIKQVRFSWLGPQRLEGVQAHSEAVNANASEIVSDVPFWSIGSFAKRIAKINIEFSAQQMPSVQLDRLAKANGLLEAFLGQTFNASGSVSLKNDQGGLNVELSSSNATASVHGRFTPEALVLEKPLLITFRLTPALSTALTNDALAIESQDPATLRIEPEGFSAPRDLSLQTLHIARGSLNLRRFRLEHANLAPLATLLRSKFGNSIDVWLTDIDFKLNEGILKMGRGDALLADSLHLCGWGKVDLKNKRLNATLGIPADTLKKAFGISSVSASYVLQIPVTDRLSDPKIDTSGASAKITALIAAGQVQKQGGALGGAATIITRAAEEKSPPPKKPFPWER